MTSDTSLSERLQQNSASRYAAAFFAVAFALVIGRALGPLLDGYVPYIAVFPAIAFCAWYCGLGPSVLAVILALMGLKYWVIPPVHAIPVVTAREALSAFTLLVAFAAIVGMVEAHRRENVALRRVQGELEDRVKQRTTELEGANQGLSDLTARLMQLQDDERRRIARELHDSVGQNMAALSMNLTNVAADLERLGKTAQMVADSTALVQEMSQEVRTISYLLHPPLLDESGLVSALRCYIEGFSQRSKIEVDLDVAEEFSRLPREVETGVFRTVQECLTNIHRHSESLTARIRLSNHDGEIHLRVEDDGTGIAAQKLGEIMSNGMPGVGIRGMRERLRQLGGTLEINSEAKGTVVEACVPVANSSTAAA